MRTVWTFTGIAVPFLWGAGLTTLGYPHPEFLLAGGCFILGGVVLLGTIAMWVYRNWPLKGIQTGIAMVVLLVIAVVGPTAGLLWIGSQKAEAQTPPSITNNAPSINTFNQSGGNNIVNVGPQRLSFDHSIGEQLISKLPAGKMIILQSIGSASDQKVADQYQQFLESRGFKVERVWVGMMVPPPDHKITLGDPNAAKMDVIIAPSAE